MSIKVRYLFQSFKKPISVQRESKFSKNNNEELLPLIKLKEKKTPFWQQQRIERSKQARLVRGKTKNKAKA